MHAVYELRPMLDKGVPKGTFDPLYLLDNSPISPRHQTLTSEFCPRDVASRNWQAPRLASLWRAPEVVNPLPAQVNDYPTIALLVPAFSERAVTALQDLLEPNGEILPLKCKTGKYYAYNVTTIADVLNREASRINWVGHGLHRLRKFEPVTASKILHYELFPDRLANLVIFRIPEHLIHYYVTEQFVERVQRHDLRGFNFRKVWPLPRPKDAGVGLMEMERRAGLR